LNVLGSIAGPLVAGFWLLPSFGERGALVILAVPLFALAILAAAKPSLVGAGDMVTRRGPAVVVGLALLIGGGGLIVATKGFDAAIPGALVRRDHTATVIATEINGHKMLLVNGHGTTVLTSITKMMAHLPLAIHESSPRDTLVICFGMGTTFRSALTWGGNVTVVELVPSVPLMFGFYHPDTAKVLTSPRGRIVIDDGRRFLERSTQTWDVITLDPPFPVEMAGSGLLYAREFYAAARRRLRPDGVMQQWLPNTEPAVQSAAARAIVESFPHVRVFAPGRAQNQFAGLFFVARQVPIANRPPAALAERLPAAAAADLIEWVPGSAPADHFNVVLAQEVPIASVIALAPTAPTMVDDRPVNEYFFVRRLLE
jgi:spermidine synthase